MNLESCWGRRRMGMIQYTSSSDISRSVAFLRCLPSSFFSIEPCAVCFIHVKKKQDCCNQPSTAESLLRTVYDGRTVLVKQPSFAKKKLHTDQVCFKDQTLSLYPINGSKCLHGAHISQNSEKAEKTVHVFKHFRLTPACMSAL